MKKYMIVGLLTSLVMIVIAGGTVLYFKLNPVKSATNDSYASRELLSPTQEKEQINTKDAIPLVWSGTDANVKTFSFKNINAIYNEKKSQTIMDAIQKEIDKNKYTIDNPYWAKNPFGTNQLSFYLYFETPEEVRVEYTIYVEDSKIPNFTRTLYNEELGSLAKIHEYQIIGLIPGMDNFIQIRLYNKKDKLILTKLYQAKIEKLDASIATSLKLTKGYSKEILSKGLFFLLGKDGGNKSTTKNILAYDNSGILRVAIPLVDYRADQIEVVQDVMYYSYDKDKIACVSNLGQVIKTYDLGRYEMHHDFVYNGYGQLWILATDLKKSSHAVNDILISLDVDTKKIVKIADFQTIFPKAYQVAKKNSDQDTINWIDLDSIVMTSSNDVIFSSRKLSSIIKIKNINSKFPTISYIIGDEKLWKNYGQEDKLLVKVNEEGKTKEEVKAEQVPIIDTIFPDESEPEEVFESQYGQHTVFYEERAGLSDGQYDLIMFNNNTKGIGDKKSKYYRYLVDENTKTYTLLESIEVMYSNNMGSVQHSEGNRIINSGKADLFGEYDKEGKAIYEYACPVDTYTYRVFKYTMDKFWF